MSLAAGATVVDLPRGGKLVRWGDFGCQIGAYPETIKDTMSSSDGVPTLFIVPEEPFDIRLGVSAAELEFPVYFNYYIRGRKFRFLCRRRQMLPILRVLREAIFGPCRVALEAEYLQGAQSFGFPDLKREMSFYKEAPERPRGRIQLRDIVEPYAFDRHGRAEVDGVTIELAGRDRYRFRRQDETLEVDFRPREAPPSRLAEPSRTFKPPVFGITVIGSGHGFDATTRTSGFVIWLNGKGVLVDPPVDSTDWMTRQGVDTRLIDDLVLTHCHADHDAGTLQKVLQEGRVNLHTTPTVLQSFVRKYRSLIGLSSAEFQGLFNFVPVLIGQSVNIAGGSFLLKYTLHSIPTLGFQVTFQGKTFAYSCDTLYDPDEIRRLHQRGVLSHSRMEDLLGFNWDADLIFHEAGVPPIHTPMQVLVDLPEPVKERLFVCHVSPGAIPEGSRLRLAPTGVDHTLELDVPVPEVMLAQRMLDVLAHIDLFENFSIPKAVEFLNITHAMRCAGGEQIIERGTKGDRFFMILSGEVDVRKNGKLVQRAGRYDYFGEIAVIMELPRAADVFAREDVELLWISRDDFLSFIRNTELPWLFRRVAQNRITDSWALFAQNSILKTLTPFQKTQLLAIMGKREAAPGEQLFAAGSPVDRLFLVERGEVRVRRGGEERTVGRGALIGGVSRLDQKAVYPAEARACERVRLFRLKMPEMERFFRSNPGAYVRLLRAADELGVVR
ncbi:MAG: cAMP/cGMP-dependent 3',5'-cyclic-AMP/GMP phosphodiesterase [Armatimonadetes bacterium]|nr:cAMP/cGMP-dependent 3',5'-cyclic-AMP/GMP phosphodiesterase [Armatimonadota bacterium]